MIREYFKRIDFKRIGVEDMAQALYDVTEHFKDPEMLKKTLKLAPFWSVPYFPATLLKTMLNPAIIPLDLLDQMTGEK